jgi:hypothetical protein
MPAGTVGARGPRTYVGHSASSSSAEARDDQPSKETFPMSKRLSLALLVAVLGVAAFTGMTLATPASGVTNTSIGSGVLAESNLNIKTGDWKMDFRT